MTRQVVEPTKAIPSQSDVTKQARKEIAEDAKVALEKIRAAEKSAGKGKVGDLETPLSGLTADDEFAVIINEFVPRKAKAKVGQKVTWTFDGFSHTVSFNVPKYFPLFTTAKDGTISLTPAAGFTGNAKAIYQQTDASGGTVAAPVKFTVGAQPAADLRSVNRAEIPATGGPSPMQLTLGALLTALGATIAEISRRSR